MNLIYMNEIWKDIEGYEGLYQVSNLGNIKSFCNNKTIILKQTNICKYGHKKVTLCKNGVKKVMTVHRLVAKAFIPNPDNKPEIDHIDTNPSNNRVDNLRWVTSKENTNNPLTKIKQNRHIVMQYDKEGNFIQSFDSLHEANDKTGIYHGLISLCCRGKSRTAGGYVWRYKE